MVTIHVPPLRERREDIPRLVDYFLERYVRELNITKPPVAPDARQKLQESPWPGNVRQLAHCVQRALIFTRGYPIQAADLPLEQDLGPNRALATRLWEDGLGDLARHYLATYTGDRAFDEFIMRAEKLLITEALQRARGNQTHAARLLGLPRPTLHAKIQKHQLHEDADR